MQEDLKVPYIDKEVIKHLKGVYDMSYTIDIAVSNTNSAEESLGFMKGIEHIISTLEAYTVMQEGD